MLVYNKRRSRFGLEYFEKVPPTKLTEGRKLKLHQEGWGLITDYYLESVKINYQKDGSVISTATLKIADRSGQISCVIKGQITGLLFGVSLDEWANIEKLCGKREQLFYRYFKNGLSKNFSFEQKIFYNFCLSNQTTDLLVAVFSRCINMRNKDKNDAFLYIMDLKKCDHFILDLYINHLRQK